MGTRRGARDARGGFLARLSRSVGSPLDWTDVQKTVLLFVPPVPFILFYIARIESLLAHPEAEPYIDRPSLVFVERMLFLFLAVFGALSATWLALRRSHGSHEVFVRTAIYAWFVSIGLASYVVGPFSSPVLLGFLAGGMTAFLLFDARRVASGAVLGMAVLIGTTLLERLRLIPYGPVFAGVVFEGRRPPDTWVYWNLAFTVVLTSFVLAATGVAMTLARQRQAEIAMLLRVDPLTGLANRRTIDATLAIEVARSKRSGIGFAIVMIDLDHFKRINDTHGHAAGDMVLVETGAAVRRNLREVDVAGRYGGEELILLLPDTDLRGARAVAERVRLAIAELTVGIGGAEVLHVTASAGCAAFAPETNVDADEVVKSADAAMYRAKAKGRNRVEVAEEDAVPLAAD
ncbi:MAG: GGDEF domain-containing protein [Polyangiales bacterium]